MQDGSAAARYAVQIIYVGAVVACTTLALAPSVLLLPQSSSDGYRIALLAAIVVFALYAAYARPNERSKILAWVAAGAGLTIASFLIFRLMPLEVRMRIPTPDILPRLLNVDGELADDTFLYEVVNEIWLALAAIAVAIGLATVKLRKAGLFSRF